MPKHRAKEKPIFFMYYYFKKSRPKNLTQHLTIQYILRLPTVVLAFSHAVVEISNSNTILYSGMICFTDKTQLWGRNLRTVSN